MGVLYHENTRMHTASIGTARATLPAGSYQQPAFSAAHLRLVSPTAELDLSIEHDGRVGDIDLALDDDRFVVRAKHPSGLERPHEQKTF